MVKPTDAHSQTHKSDAPCKCSGALMFHKPVGFLVAKTISFGHKIDVFVTTPRQVQQN